MTGPVLSLPARVTLPCPYCAHPNERDLTAADDATARFIDCAACGLTFVIYVDLRRHIDIYQASRPCGTAAP